jgi:hypothetical protein
MPRFKSLDNILNNTGEIFDPAWLQGDHIVVPPFPDWAESREITVEDVLVWEVISESSLAHGFYAAWNPHAEFYLHMENGKIVGTHHGHAGHKHIENKLNEKGILHAPVRNKQHLQHHPMLRHSDQLIWHKSDHHDQPILPTVPPLTKSQPDPNIVQPQVIPVDNPQAPPIEIQQLNIIGPNSPSPVYTDPITGKTIEGVMPDGTAPVPEAPNIHWPRVN